MAIKIPFEAGDKLLSW